MKHNDTLGRRIQACRKTAGLSQEALGEQLRVSRQAVSKWESDITVPELDSLIAMSRLFGVSVGALLGVEEPSAGAPTGPENGEATPDAGADAAQADSEAHAPSPGLTEKELAAVEAIAARYAREAEQHRSPKLSRRKVQFLAAAACLLAVAAGRYVCKKLETIDRRFNELEYEVDDVARSVSSQIHNLTAQMEDILTKQANILADFSVSMVSADAQEETVTLQLTAFPKEWTTTTTAVFTLTSDGEPISSEPVEGIGGVFTSPAMTVPMSGEILPSVTLLDGTAARTETMEPLYDYHPDSFRPYLSHCTWASTCYTGGTVILNKLKLGIDLPHGGRTIQIAHGEMQLYRNFAAEPEQTVAIPMLLNTQAVQGNRIWLDSIGDEHKATISLEDGDTVIAVLMLTDDFGRTTYRIIEAFVREGKAVNQNRQLEGLDWIPGTTPGSPNTYTAAKSSTAAPAALNREDVTLSVGDSFTLKVSGITSDLTWSTGSAGIASVSDSGVITGVTAGNTTVTAHWDGGSASCTVRVK